MTRRGGRCARAGAAFALCGALIACAKRASNADSTARPPDGVPPAAQVATLPSADSTRLARILGVLRESRDAGPCLWIGDSAIAPGTTLVAIEPADTQKVITATVRRKRDKPCTQPEDEGGSVSHEPTYWYDVALEPGAESMSLRIAVLGPSRLPPVVNGRVQLDVDGDGANDLFSECASGEGIHLRVASGGGAWKWGRYYYVPYDLEPNCPP